MAGRVEATNPLGALRTALRNDVRQAELLLAELHIASREHALVRALILAADGWHHAADSELHRAIQLGGLADYTSWLRALGDVVVITGPRQRRLADAAGLARPSDAVVLDAPGDELIVRGESRPLRRHTVRRRLLYALARQPGRVIDKETLVQRVWECGYDPLRHDDTLKSNILHLRQLIAGRGIEIACGHPGYRLDVRTRFLFVFAFELGNTLSPSFTDSALSPSGSE